MKSRKTPVHTRFRQVSALPLAPYWRSRRRRCRRSTGLGWRRAQRLTSYPRVKGRETRGSEARGKSEPPRGQEELTATVELRKVVPKENCYRRYKLSEQKLLFGGYDLVDRKSGVEGKRVDLG